MNKWFGNQSKDLGRASGLYLIVYIEFPRFGKIFFGLFELYFTLKKLWSEGKILVTSGSDLATSWRTRVQTESKLCSTNGPLLGSFVLASLPWWPKEPSPNPFTNQQKLFYIKIKCFLLKVHFPQLFVEKLVLGRQIFLLEGEIVLFKAWKLKLVWQNSFLKCFQMRKLFAPRPVKCLRYARYARYAKCLNPSTGAVLPLNAVT